MSNIYKDQLSDKICDLVFEVCAQCHSPECREVFAGDEGWTVCPDCQSVEQGYSDAIDINDLSPMDFAEASMAGLLKDVVLLQDGEDYDPTPNDGGVE